MLFKSSLSFTALTWLPHVVEICNVYLAAGERSVKKQSKLKKKEHLQMWDTTPKELFLNPDNTRVSGPNGFRSAGLVATNASNVTQFCPFPSISVTSALPTTYHHLWALAPIFNRYTLQKHKDTCSYNYCNSLAVYSVNIAKGLWRKVQRISRAK